MKTNIILIGFMGVGKGTIAREMANISDMFAIDTDDLIESLQNQKIKTIFDTNGEKYFRFLEKKCAIWCEKNLTNTIISTGGGFYKQTNIKQIGTIVYLKNSFNNIVQSLKEAPNSAKKFKKRPLLKDLKKAKQLYNIRAKEYENIADIVINVSNNKQKLAKKILKKARV